VVRSGVARAGRSGGGRVRQRIYFCTRAVIACEVRDVAGYDVGFAWLDSRYPASLDLDRETALERVKHFLSARMHVPGCRYARPEIHDADHGLLNRLALPFHVLFQDLRELGRPLASGPMQSARRRVPRPTHRRPAGIGDE
jgi:hypothetical protein